MTITQEDGSKRATCPDCGQVVQIPASDLPFRRRSAPTGARSESKLLAERGNLTPDPTRGPAKAKSHSGGETRLGVVPAVHELPTRVEDGASEVNEYYSSLPLRKQMR